MKLIIATLAALTLAAPAFALPAWTQCATIDKGGYSIFADPTCPNGGGNIDLSQDGAGEEARQIAAQEEQAQ